MTDILEQRRQQKVLRDKYLAVAKRQYLPIGVNACELKVDNNPTVHVMQDGGAFVDAQIWVPKEAIE